MVIGTHILGDTLPGNGAVEQTAKCSAIDVADLDAEADYALDKLIHNDQDSMDLEADRLAAKWSRALAPGDIAAAGFQRPLTEPGEHLSLCTRLSRNHGAHRSTLQRLFIAWPMTVSPSFLIPIQGFRINT
jgi:hypothetical protein